MVEETSCCYGKNKIANRNLFYQTISFVTFLVALVITVGGESGLVFFQKMIKKYPTLIRMLLALGRRLLE